MKAHYISNELFYFREFIHNFAIMEEQLISRETAELARSKGFDSRVILDKIFRTGSNICTQSLLQRWLRETHKIFVSVDFIVENTSGMAYIKYDNEPIKYTLAVEYITEHNIWDYLEHDFDDFETYEEALEVGLQEALKLIK